MTVEVQPPDVIQITVTSPDVVDLSIVTPDVIQLNLDTTGTFDVAGLEVGGDLQGTLPNPSVHQIRGIDIQHGSGPDNNDIFQYQSSNGKWHYHSLSEAGIAPVVHTHVIADVTNLQTTLDGKAPLSHTHALSDLTQSSAEKYMVPHWDGTAWVAIDTLGNMKRQSVASEMNAAGEWTVYSQGTGASNTFTQAGLTHRVGHFGILRSGTGTTSSGLAGIGSASATDGVALGTYVQEFRTILYIPTLSNSTERFYVYAGFMDARATVAPVDAVRFNYKDDLNGGKWLCEIYNNNTLYSQDSGVTVSAGTWYNLRIVVDGVFAYFYINNSLVHTSGVLQIPTGITRELGLNVGIAKQTGSTARVVDIDYLSYILDAER